MVIIKQYMFAVILVCIIKILMIKLIIVCKKTNVMKWVDNIHMFNIILIKDNVYHNVK